MVSYRKLQIIWRTQRDKEFELFLPWPSIEKPSRQYKILDRRSFSSNWYRYLKDKHISLLSPSLSHSKKIFLSQLFLPNNSLLRDRRRRLHWTRPCSQISVQVCDASMPQASVAVRVCEGVCNVHCATMWYLKCKCAMPRCLRPLLQCKSVQMCN